MGFLVNKGQRWFIARKCLVFMLMALLLSFGSKAVAQEDNDIIEEQSVTGFYPYPFVLQGDFTVTWTSKGTNQAAKTDYSSTWTITVTGLRLGLASGRFLNPAVYDVFGGTWQGSGSAVETVYVPKESGGQCTIVTNVDISGKGKLWLFNPKNKLKIDILQNKFELRLLTRESDSKASGTITDNCYGQNLSKSDTFQFDSLVTGEWHRDEGEPFTVDLNQSGSGTLRGSTWITYTWKSTGTLREVDR